MISSGIKTAPKIASGVRTASNIVSKTAKPGLLRGTRNWLRKVQRNANLAAQSSGSNHYTTNAEIKSGGFGDVSYRDFERALLQDRAADSFKLYSGALGSAAGTAGAIYGELKK